MEVDMPERKEPAGAPQPGPARDKFVAGFCVPPPQARPGAVQPHERKAAAAVHESKTTGQEGVAQGAAAQGEPPAPPATAPPSAFEDVQSFLRPGVRFEGTQAISTAQDAWRVSVTIDEADLGAGTLRGSMEALGVSENGGTVTTFWEGEVIDCRNHWFWTRRWSTSAHVDLAHWSRFPGAAPVTRLLSKRGASDDRTRLLREYVARSRYIYMRWKERFFVSPGGDSGLTIAGFYYVCMDRCSGEVCGFYCDPNSTPFQKLHLVPRAGGPEGDYSVGEYSFR